MPTIPSNSASRSNFWFISLSSTAQHTNRLGYLLYLVDDSNVKIKEVVGTLYHSAHL